MPIYEYVCEDCGRVQSFLVMPMEEFEPVCKRCGSRNLRRIISRVRVRYSEETRLDRISDPSMWGGLDERDPKSVMKAIDKMGAAVGDELGEDFSSIKEEMEELIEEEMKGEKGEEEKEDEEL